MPVRLVSPVALIRSLERAALLALGAGLALALGAILAILAPTASAQATCDTVAAHVMDGALVPLFGGTPVPAVTVQATYVQGTMKRYAGETGWDIQHPANPWGRGVFAVDSGSTVFFMLPAISWNQPTQAAEEAANAGASNTFSWPGGSMYFQHVDSPYNDNTAGTNNPTWQICFTPPPPP
ncbi:MAG: hypothetical protein ABR562_04795, partial [Thermoplasmatota archaeon]